VRSVFTLFSPADRDRIKAAVEAAEGKTSGEIVPYVVDHSDNYEDAEWRSAFLFAFMTFCIVVAVRSFTSVWLPLNVVEIGLATLAAGALAMLLVKYVRPVKTFFAGRHLIDHRVAQRAAEAFISEEVFNTRDRTGILIFVSLLEHRVLVIGDAGINASVKKADWHDVVQRVVKGINDGKITEGLVDAILQCGSLLEQHGLKRRADDSDELSDSLRVSDR
jgi:putative membrane protein